MTTKPILYPVVQCHWCGFEGLTEVARRIDYVPVLRCEQCGLTFTGELPNDLAVLYDNGYFSRGTRREGTTGYEDYDQLTPSSFRWISLLAVAVVGRAGANLLDVGAANGAFLEMARQDGFKVAGVELNAAAAKAARRRGLDVRQGLFDPSNWPESSFDLVTALEVIEHVTDIRGFIRHLLSAMKPDGVLCFMVPSVPQSRIDTLKDDLPDFQASLEHTLYLNPQIIQAIFSELLPNGSLEVVEFTTADGAARYLLGFARKQPIANSPESRISRALRDESLVAGLSPQEILALCLVLAKFGHFERAESALAVARPLQIPTREFALAEAQLARSKGEFYRALAAVNGVINTEPMASRALEDVLYQELLGEAVAAGDLPGDPRLGVVDMLKLADARTQEAISWREAFHLSEEQVRMAQAQQTDIKSQLTAIHSSRAWKTASSYFYLRGAVVNGVRRMWGFVRSVGGIRPISGPHTNLSAKKHRRRAVATPADAALHTHSPLISVIVPVFNKGAATEAAIQSLLNQTMTDFEIIIWDDGSTDPVTLSTLNQLHDPRIHLFRGPNRGVILARNAAMAASSGEFICCLDPDDRFEATYLEKAITLMLADSEVDLAYPWVQTEGTINEIWEAVDLDPTAIATAPHVPVCAVFRRSVLRATGGFSPAMKAGYEDWEFWAHAAHLGFRGRVIPEPLFHYTSSDDYATSRNVSAIANHVHLARIIAERHSDLLLGHTQSRLASPPVLGDWIRQLPRRFPQGQGRPVILALPWLTTGGADNLVETLIRHWCSQGRTVVVFTTDRLARGMNDRFAELLELTPFSYSLPHIAPQEDWLNIVSGFFDALPNATCMNVGSRWLLRHLDQLLAGHDDIQVIDQQFNDVGHFTSNIAATALVDVTVACYAELAEKLHAAKGTSDRVELIHIAIPVPERPPEEEISALRNDLGLEASCKVITYVGRLSPEKQPNWLLGLSKSIRGQATRIVAVGDGPLARELGPAFARAKIKWLRRVPHPEPFLALSDLVVIPSQTEGIPLVMLEALMLGTPVVASRVGGMKELEGHPGVTLFDPATETAFHNAVSAAMAKPKGDFRLGERFSVPSMLKAYDRVVEGATDPVLPAAHTSVQPVS